MMSRVPCLRVISRRRLVVSRFGQHDADIRHDRLGQHTGDVFGSRALPLVLDDH